MGEGLEASEVKIEFVRADNGSGPDVHHVHIRGCLNSWELEHAIQRVLACARLVHKCLSWDKVGIRIISSGGLSTGFEAKTCLACDPAPCVEACPTGAYSQRKGGGVVVKKKLCIHCGECARACPVDAIFLDRTGEPFVCIHCGRCVPSVRTIVSNSGTSGDEKEQAGTIMIRIISGVLRVQLERRRK
jgi:MinD superfamily P-loop ATPase